MTSIEASGRDGNHVPLHTIPFRDSGMLSTSTPLVFVNQRATLHDSEIRTKLSDCCLNHEKMERIGKLFFGLDIFAFIGMFVLGGKSTVDCDALGHCKSYIEPLQSACITQYTPICNNEWNGFIATIVAVFVFTLSSLIAFERAKSLHKRDFQRLNDI